MVQFPVINCHASAATIGIMAAIHRTKAIFVPTLSFRLSLQTLEAGHVVFYEINDRKAGPIQLPVSSGSFRRKKGIYQDDRFAIRRPLTFRAGPPRALTDRGVCQGPYLSFRKVNERIFAHIRISIPCFQILPPSADSE